MSMQNNSSTIILDILTILTLVGVCIVGIVGVSIYANPASAFNPFPPPTLPASIVLPSGTPTPVNMPPTWTPVGVNSNPIEKVDTQTPLPSATIFVLPSFTPTFTITPSPTETETPKPTRTPTKTRVPNTNTPKPTTALVCLKISQSMNLDQAPTITDPGAYSGVITAKGDPHLKLSGVSVSFSSSKKTTVTWTCSATDATCKASGKSFSVTSIKMYATGSVEITINGVIPKNTKKGITFTSAVHPPSGTSNQCKSSDSTTWHW
jgi:hypothetical protein